MKLLDYIKQISKLQKQCSNISRDEFILQNGKHFIPQSLPQHLVKYQGRKKECFKNAYQFAGNGFTYVEGYAFSIIPVEHAWCVDNEGKVYEITWDEPGSEYFGVQFNFEYIMEIALMKKCYGILDTVDLINGKHTHWKQEML